MAAKTCLATVSQNYPIEEKLWNQLQNCANSKKCALLPRNFILEPNWERLMNKYWDKVAGFLDEK
jgi:hypothetical protein